MGGRHRPGLMARVEDEDCAKNDAKLRGNVAEIEEPRGRQNANDDERGSDGDIQDPQDHPNVHTDKDGPLFGRFKGNVRRGNLCRAGRVLFSLYLTP